MRLVKYESYIVTVNFSGSPDDSSVFFNFYADDEIAIRKYE